MRKTTLMNKAIAFISTSALCIGMISSSVLAKNETITLAKNQVWNTRSEISRTAKYSYVQAKCVAVYPTSGSDNFSKIQCTVANSSGTAIAAKDYYTLTEGNAYSNMTIKEGSLNVKTVKFKFRGNSSSGAKADVTYVGK